MGEENPRIEFSALDGLIEIRYFDIPKDRLYRSWKMPLSIADDLTAWRQKMKKQEDIVFPLKARTKTCELTMNTGKYIEIKSLDCHGRTNMTGWNFPTSVADSLSKWRTSEVI